MYSTRAIRNTFYRRSGKRLIDILITIPFLLLVSPILVLTAVLIRLDSHGPVFFLQERLGRDGRVFLTYKFRTMTDAVRTARREVYGKTDEVTRVGYWLRRFKIDELPQLFNVVIGDMSLVGPRPALPAQLDEYNDAGRRRLLVRPGLTGLAQIHGNIYLTWPQRWQWDAQYVDRLSPGLDLWIAMRTFAVVVLGEERFLQTLTNGNQSIEKRRELNMTDAKSEGPGESELRIVLAGSVGSSRRALEALIRHNANVVGVLELRPKSEASVSDYTRLSGVAAAADIPCVGFQNINDDETVSAVCDWQPDVFFVVGLSQLVKPKLLSLPRLGCIGFHPTALPAGRGRAPVAWLTLDATDGAATFFLMDEGADSGPIFVQERVAVTVDDYAGDVANSIEAAMDRALDRWLPQFLAGKWDPQPQDDSLATYHCKRAPEDGLIDWNRPAREIHALIRAASHPHPGAYTYLKKRPFIVWRADIENDIPIRGVPGRILLTDDNRGSLIQTGDGLLWLTDVAWAAPQPQISSQPVLRVGVKLGFVVEDELHQLTNRIIELERRLEELHSALPIGIQKKCAS